ncbi:MAG: MarR family winged helix-turn-helix transcriptional regulator [Oscillospiraceae bacterium]
MSAVRCAHNAFECAVHPYCAENGLTPQQLRVLMTLDFTGAQTAGELARRTGMAPANNSALCKRLAQQGLIERSRQRPDERQVVISLTQQGQQQVRQFKDAFKKAAPSLARQIPPEDAGQLAEALNQMAALMGAREEQQNEQ